jgi:hypothetical protein
MRRWSSVELGLKVEVRSTNPPVSQYFDNHFADDDTIDLESEYCFPGKAE